MAKLIALQPIKDRIADYEAEIEKLEQRLVKARESRDQLLTSLHALEVEFGLKKTEPARGKVRKRASDAIPNLRDRILIALKRAGANGLQTPDLEDAIVSTWGAPIVTNSLRTFLSEHKKKGNIIRESKHWKYIKGI